METEKGFSFQSWTSFAKLISTCLLVSSQASFATPLVPIDQAEVNKRTAQLQEGPIDFTSVKLVRSRVLRACKIDDINFAVQDPIDHSVKTMSVTHFHPITDGTYPTMIVVPTILGRTLIEESISYRFCRENMGSVIADFNDTVIPSLLPNWQIHDVANRATVLALRTLIDLLERNSQVDSKNIGALGLSLGAYSVSLLASVDSRLKAVGLVAGAGNMPAVLSYSMQVKPLTLRNLRMNAINDHDVNHYEQTLRANVSYDPIYFAKNVNPRNVFMLLDINDTSVPAENQIELWNAFGKPQRIDVRITHDELIVAAATTYFDDILKNIVSRINQ